MAGNNNNSSQINAPTFQQLKDLSQLRLEEAKTLYNNSLYDGATYLAHYSIELALKAAICKLLKFSEYDTVGDYAAFKIHDTKKLLIFAGLRKDWEAQKIANTDFKTYASKLEADWTTSRYLAKGAATQLNTLDFLNGIGNPEQTDPTNPSYFISPTDPSIPTTIGLFTWIKKHW